MFLVLQRHGDNSKVIVNINEIQSVTEVELSLDTTYIKCTSVHFLHRNDYMRVKETPEEIANLLCKITTICHVPFN